MFFAARIGDSTAHGGTIASGFPQVLIGNMPASRITDMHACPMQTPAPIPVPHVGGPIFTGAFNVLVGNMPQARVTDKAICVGPPDVIMKGEMTVTVGTAMSGGGLGGLLCGLISAVMAMLSPPYPRSVLQPDGTIVTEYQEGLVIQGDSEFQAIVTADLNQIASTPSGEAMLEDLAGTGKTTTIVPTTSGNGISGTGHANRRPNGDLGQGSDTTVSYDPVNGTLGNQPWQTRPPAIGLAHELIHAVHFQEGSRTTTPVANDNKPNPANPGQQSMLEEEEVRTTGVPPYDTSEPYSENSIRDEWDPPQPERLWY